MLISDKSLCPVQIVQAHTSYLLVDTVLHFGTLVNLAPRYTRQSNMLINNTSLVTRLK